jgi:hypothetical protein
MHRGRARVKTYERRDGITSSSRLYCGVPVINDVLLVEVKLLVALYALASAPWRPETRWRSTAAAAARHGIDDAPWEVSPVVARI